MNIVRICSIDKKCCIFFIITLFILSSGSSKQYRTDYVYNSETDAFYKFHMETAYYPEAHRLCAAEGASLMVPMSEEDLTQAHGLFKQYPDIGDLAWIENDGNKHESTEEIPLINLDYLHTSVESDQSHSWNECDVFKRNGEVLRSTCYQALPFICKVDAKDTFHDKQCNVFAKGYKYFENVGSCYKIPTKVCAWNEAYAICHGEGAHLIILNSELERQVIYNFTNDEQPGNIAHTYWSFFAGIRAEKTTDGSPIVFKTIFNQTLEELGYSPWGPNEPKHANGNEYCVTVFKGDGYYNDYNCATRLAFICQNKVRRSVMREIEHEGGFKEKKH